jgi:hypothetical protein
VSASSTLGLQRMVDIRAPVTNLSGAVASLPQAFMNVARLLSARCAARLGGGNVSNLVVDGREALPFDPGGLLPAPSCWMTGWRRTGDDREASLAAIHE